MNTTRPDIIVYIDGASGIYCPQRFAKKTKRECVTGVSAEDWEILEEGPDHEFYWEAWQAVTDNAIITDPATGVKYTIYQDDSVFLIPEEMEWSDERNCFEWPSEDIG